MRKCTLSQGCLHRQKGGFSSLDDARSSQNWIFGLLVGVELIVNLSRQSHSLVCGLWLVESSDSAKDRTRHIETEILRQWMQNQ